MAKFTVAFRLKNITNNQNGSYLVEKAGLIKCRGTYTYLDEYNDHHRYEMTAGGETFYICWDDTGMPSGNMGWVLKTSSGAAYSAPNSPADSMPENVTWVISAVRWRYKSASNFHTA